MNFAIAMNEATQDYFVVNLDTVQSIENMGPNDNRYTITFTDGSVIKPINPCIIHEIIKDIDHIRNLSIAEAEVNVCEQSPEVFSQLKSKYQRYKASGHDNRFMHGYSEGFRCCANVLGIDTSNWDC